MSPKIFMGLFGMGVLISWFIATDRRAEKEIRALKHREIKGTIYRMFKKPGEKNYTLQFRDKSTFSLPYFAPSDRIHPGDSIFKAADTFHYVLFLNQEKQDTITFEGMVDGKYIP